MLVVASYNIHGCVGVDGRADHARVLRVLTDLRADVIALQEVHGYEHGDGWRKHLDLFAEETGMTAIGGPTHHRAQGDFGNGLLTRLTVRSTRLVEISVHRREPRGVIEVVLERASDAPLRLITTHLGLGAEERRIQWQTIADLAREDAQTPLVLLGDFNEWLAWARPLRAIEEQMGRARAVPTFPSPFPLLSLDRIWVRPAASLLRIEAVTTREARVASDHLPLRALLAL